MQNGLMKIKAGTLQFNDTLKIFFFWCEYFMVGQGKTFSYFGVNISWLDNGQEYTFLS